MCQNICSYSNFTWPLLTNTYMHPKVLFSVPCNHVSNDMACEVQNSCKDFQGKIWVTVVYVLSVVGPRLANHSKSYNHSWHPTNTFWYNHTNTSRLSQVYDKVFWWILSSRMMLAAGHKRLSSLSEVKTDCVMKSSKQSWWA